MLVDSRLCGFTALASFFSPLSSRYIDPPMEYPGSASSSAAVCCMCGDHGLPLELFRCTHCRQRLQHRYCSDLYPRATAYRRCNWCLRRPRAPPAVKPATAAKRRMSAALEMMSDYSEEDKRRRSSCVGGGCSRSAFCAEADKPVKKPKAGDDNPLVMPPMVEETTTTSVTTKGRKPHSSAGKTRFRVKVRRYKLLTEVISC